MGQRAGNGRRAQKGGEKKRERERNYTWLYEGGNHGHGLRRRLGVAQFSLFLLPSLFLHLSRIQRRRHHHLCCCGSRRRGRRKKDFWDLALAATSTSQGSQTPREENRAPPSELDENPRITVSSRQKKVREGKGRDLDPTPNNQNPTTSLPGISPFKKETLFFPFLFTQVRNGREGPQKLNSCPRLLFSGGPPPPPPHSKKVQKY